MKPMIRIHNSETNEVIDREMTNAEFADYQAQEAKDAAMAEERAKAETNKAALLSKLGITADEAALLLG
jgi:hypothetical protein